MMQALLRASPRHVGLGVFYTIFFILQSAAGGPVGGGGNYRALSKEVTTPFVFEYCDIPGKYF